MKKRWIQTFLICKVYFSALSKIGIDNANHRSRRIDIASIQVRIKYHFDRADVGGW